MCVGATFRSHRNHFSPIPLFARNWNKGWVEMSDTYIIEVSSKAAGIVVRNPDGYRFFAACHEFNRLEGQVFRSAREAERAANRVARGEYTLAA
jgi:hypothetical protein